MLGVLIAGNIVFHLEAIWRGHADYGIRIGIAALIGLIMLVGGRIVPSFTHNWLAKNNPGRMPRPFSRYDAATIGISALALAFWIAIPQSIVSGGLLILAGLLQAIRHLRWAGDRTLVDRLVLVLHVAYAFVPIGFLLIGAATLWPSVWPRSAGIHAWTAGAVGLMTLAVMTRASLGHTGRPLAASLPTQLIYLCVLVAALTRILAAFEPSVGSFTPPDLPGSWHSAASRCSLVRCWRGARRFGAAGHNWQSARLGCLHIAPAMPT